MNQEKSEKITEIDFSKTVSELESKLKEGTNVTLATSLKDRVTARTVQYISEGLCIYFTSWGFNKKIRQIEGNSNVALSLQGIQIEGEAEIFKFPLKGEIKNIEAKFIEKYKWFSQLSENSEAVLVKVKPKKIVKFAIIDKIFHLQNIDLENEKVYQMRLSDKENPNYPM